ncbi:MAG: triose-phosphate isomerase [Chloroflexi bacterium]|nr:triose-phosphate isomerase [Chloroflexota bacterium]
MNSRQITVIANWKANLPPSEEVALAKEIAAGLGNANRAAGGGAAVRLLFAPSALGLVPVASLLRREFPSAEVTVAAQDASSMGSGPFTGELPADHLVGIADAVILGHSERRRVAGESGDVIGQKLARVVAAGLAPILCVGDNLPTADVEARSNYVQQQCAEALEAANRLGCSRQKLLEAGLVIAYEPVWAIGTGTPATVELAEVIAGGLRRGVGSDLPILYGGSVDAASAATWLGSVANRTTLDGLLVGGASLRAESFTAIVRAAVAAAGR